MGNYMSNIRPNYFLGIRTPWALESESNWKKTHFATGRLWFFSGVILIILIIVLSASYKIYVYAGFGILLTLFPIIYSFVIYTKDEKMKNENYTAEKSLKKKTKDTYLSESDKWVYCFYFNRFDSRIIVPKRNMMRGWTLNFANPYTYILIIIIVAILVISSYI